jgi:MtfA peptidase
MIFQAWRQWRRKKVLAAPFPATWLHIIKRRIPYYHLLSEADKAKLVGHIKILLAEKHFEGCRGLRVTDEMRLVIAAQASILLLNRPADYFPKLGSIVLYPHAYIAKTRNELPGGIVSEGTEVRIGESWDLGTVVLTWEDVLDGAQDCHDGHNVVFHEFAHQLKGEAWSPILDREFNQLGADAESGRETIIDSYGATDPDEFFAVVTETFFEMPGELKEYHPELYDEFKRFYRQDPIGRS